MRKTAKKKTAPAKKAAAPQPTQEARVCAYGDRGEVVATRETPRGPQALCAVHKVQIERLGHETSPA